MDNYVVIKIGGVAGKQLDSTFFQTIKNWQAQGKNIIIVHGGGKEITQAIQESQELTKFVDGYRYTTDTVLATTKEVLLNKVQPNLIEVFKQKGIKLVSGNYKSLIQAQFLNEEKYGYVGQVTNVNQNELINLCKQGVPIFAPIGETVSGQTLNLNGDTLACGLASGIGAESLYLLTDVPGIKKDDNWLESVAIDEVAELIQTSVITGGMVPKLKHAVEAVVNGVKRVHITQQLEEHGTLIINEVSA